jgi:hypothetical protein
MLVLHRVLVRLLALPVRLMALPVRLMVRHLLLNLHLLFYLRSSSYPYILCRYRMQFSLA